MDRFNQAIARFDAANAQDPNRVLVDGQPHAKELIYAQRMTEMLGRYMPEASEVLRLAARSQHIQRWNIERTSYPMTRAGYHQWRTRLKDLHAETASAILAECGYDEQVIVRVRSLLRKENLHQDTEAQALEDVIVLVFIEHYLADFVHEHAAYDEAKLIDILCKSLKKMSPQGRTAALTMIKLPPALLPVINKAVATLNQ